MRRPRPPRKPAPSRRALLQQADAGIFTRAWRRARFPIIVYNIFGRTASKIEATTIARPAELDEVIGGRGDGSDG
jgi:dihydrodipicolinate synthase/N-acetylneuraminate lyase